MEVDLGNLERAQARHKHIKRKVVNRINDWVTKSGRFLAQVKK